MAEDRPQSVSAEAKSCMRDFEHLQRLLDGKKEGERFGLSPGLLRDQFDRYKIWVGNIGATLKPQSKGSLEHRLKEAPRVAQLVTDCLQDLQKSLTGST